MELILTNITKKYGNYEAISNQSLILKNGVYGLLGVNGAGKTTLMNMICTLSRPSGGSIMFNGKDIYKLDGKYREILGYLPQKIVLKKGSIVENGNHQELIEGRGRYYDLYTIYSEFNSLNKGNNCDDLGSYIR